jgi:RimJ/RimL family protein N-acetyltransferase
MGDDLCLRDVIAEDLPLFFRQQSGPETRQVAVPTTGKPVDCRAFAAHWQRIQADPGVTMKTIVFGGQVAGSVMSYQEEGRTEVSYWLDGEYWGRGIATRALSRFLAEVNTDRPIYARAASDNAGSLRVLQKCGFVVNGCDAASANTCDDEIDELLLILDGARDIR